MQVSISEWQGTTGESWAAEWRRTDRSFGMLTERLLQRCRDFRFSEVVDIGCGAGELSLAIARGHPEVQVSGVDISPALVAAARERGANLPNATFLVADAANWRPSGERPDFIVSRHGVMFFGDPVGAFTNIAQCATRDASLMFSCFREPALNPFMTEVARLLPPPASRPDPHAPGPFAFADKERVEGILRVAGWRDVVFESFDFGMVVGVGEDAVEDALAYFQSIGPAARARAELSAQDYEIFQQRLRDLAQANLLDGIIALRAAAWIVTANKA